MTWHCKLCSASFTTRSYLFKHCRLQHSHFSKVSPVPCLHDDCMCTFQTLSALRTHLSRYHTQEPKSSANEIQELVTFKCPLCTFQQPFSESVLLSHIRTHLKNMRQWYAHTKVVTITQMYTLHLIPIRVECTK